MDVILLLLLKFLDLYFWVIIASVVASWLLAFGVLNARHKYVAMVLRFIDRATEPVYAHIRRVIPAIGGIDLSPMILIFGIILLQQALVRALWM